LLGERTGPLASAAMETTAQAIVLADGAVGSRDAIDAAWPGWCATDPYVVAADGGARNAGPLGLQIDRWVGDGDSVSPEALATLEADGVPIDRVPFDKDESDTELALRAALAQRPGAIVILGALGGPRADHALANLTLLSLPELRDVDVRLIAADARVRLIEGPSPHGSSGRVRLEGRVGDLVTLLPLGADAVGVTTGGLAYPLRGETLLVGRTRGLSNRRTETVAEVRLGAGRLLVVETPATL
jgi:thiamine pyrophosphokinase